MGYLNQFQKFDPLTGSVPPEPFPSLQDIAKRARAILRRRTTDQIVSAAKSIDGIIDEYRASLFDQEQMIVHQSYRDNDLELVAFDKNADKSLYESIAKIYKRTDLDIFKESNDLTGDLFYNSEFKDHKSEELYSVLALWLVGSTLEMLDYEAQLKLRHKFQNQTVSTETNNKEEVVKLQNKIICIERAGEFAILAMNAICYAERLQNVKTVKVKLSVNRAKELTKKSKKLNDLRHHKNHDAKAKVLKEWEKNPSKFASASKAGVFLASWLFENDNNYAYEARTVADWIREYAKSRGIKLR